MKQLVFEQSLGRSFVNREDVNDIIIRAAPVTASLVFGGAILWLLMSIPIGVYSALRPRSLIDRERDDLRAHRDLGAPCLDRPHPVVRLRVVPRHHADLRLLRPRQPGDRRGVRRTGGVGLPHDPAVVHVRAALRGALREAHPSERDGDDERGLRAHRTGQGRRRAHGAPLARPPEQHAPDRHDPRARHRPGTRRRRLHGDDLQPAGSRPPGDRRRTRRQISR